VLELGVRVELGSGFWSWLWLRNAWVRKG